MQHHQSNSSSTMKKYQQLALVIISVVSLMGFLFYKHEYERLRYTLEYLETFGEPLESDGERHYSIINVHKTLSTPPANWVEVSANCVVYSTFWDTWDSLASPFVKAIVAVKKGSTTDIKCLLSYEHSESYISCTCSAYSLYKNKGVTLSEGDLSVNLLNCKPDSTVEIRGVPYLIQFLSDGSLSAPVFVHRSDMWKSVERRIALCVIPGKLHINSTILMEHIVFHNIIGINRFMFYGNILTSSVRTVLDKYGDEVGISYEEKTFVPTRNFNFSDTILRNIIQLDCAFRLQDSYENILVLATDEYIIPRQSELLHTVINSFSTAKSGPIKAFHFASQKVCLDKTHIKPSSLLLEKPSYALGSILKSGITVIKPQYMFVENKEYVIQHVSAASVIVYVYQKCLKSDLHKDEQHLPVSIKHVDMIKLSILFRKLKVYS